MRASRAEIIDYIRRRTSALYSAEECGRIARMTAAALSGAMPEIVSTSELVKIGATAGAMILCGLIISLLFTAFAVNKFVNMKSNKIFLY